MSTLYAHPSNIYIVLSVSTKEHFESITDSLLIKHALRIECYQNAIRNEISLYYQLDEAMEINLLQGTVINNIINLFSDMKSLSDKEQTKSENSPFYIFTGISKNFQENFQQDLYDHTF